MHIFTVHKYVKYCHMISLPTSSENNAPPRVVKGTTHQTHMAVKSFSCPVHMTMKVFPDGIPLKSDLHTHKERKKKLSYYFI